MVLPCVPPFRLDLTVSALQRLPEHPCDRWRAGRWLRAVETPAGLVGLVARQEGDAVVVELHGAARDPEALGRFAVRVLGTQVDLAPFYARAAPLPRVGPLVAAFRGVKPPRFASLWETFASTILFQQVSLAAAMSALRRLVARFSPPVMLEGEVLHAFPTTERVARAGEAAVHALGLSTTKARALCEVARAISSGALVEAELEVLPTAALLERLLALHGIGPWTAGLIALRGFRRLEVFPSGDAGAERALTNLLGEPRPHAILDALGPTRGMLYFHFLLAELEVRRAGPFGEVR